MNCRDCQENLVAYLEEALDKEIYHSISNHLSECEECSAELQSFQILNRELSNRAPMTADVSLVGSVMSRIKQLEEQQTFQEPERISFMSKILKWRWSMGLGIFAGIAGILLMIMVSGTNTVVAAAEVFNKGIKAIGEIRTMHLKGKIRSLPNDNFSGIGPDYDFIDIELWQEFKKPYKWKVTKPGRVAANDGETTILHILPDYGYKIPRPCQSAFDVIWLQRMSNIANSLSHELKSIKKNGWKSKVQDSVNASGHPISVVTVDAYSGYSSEDYLRNSFFSTADTRRIYVFDKNSGLLISAKIYLIDGSNQKLVFELLQIDYNPEFASDTFKLNLPENISWNKQDEILPDNKKYEAMTPEEAAKAFFEACTNKNWDEVGKFYTVTGSFKEYLGDVKVLKLGNSFSSAISLINGAKFVPYEIKLKNGTIKKHNIALKRHPETNRWFVDGGI